MSETHLAFVRSILFEDSKLKIFAWSVRRLWIATAIETAQLFVENVCASHAMGSQCQMDFCPMWIEETRPHIGTCGVIDP